MVDITEMIEVGLRTINSGQPLRSPDRTVMLAAEGRHSSENQSNHDKPYEGLRCALLIPEPFSSTNNVLLPPPQSDLPDNASIVHVSQSTLAHAKDSVQRLAALPSLFGEMTFASMPQYIIFTASTVCNLRCPHCWTHGQPEGRQKSNNREHDLPRDVLMSIAAECLPFASEYSLTVTGEPLLLPEFEKLVTSLGAWGARLNMVTNGTCLQPRMVAAILPHLSNLAISIDGAFASTFERLRLGAKFVSFLTNIRVLTRSLELLPEIRRPGMCLAFTSMGSNLLELPQIVRIAEALRVPCVQSTPIMVAEGRDDLAGEDMKYHWPAFARSIEAAQSLARSIGISLQAYQPDCIQPFTTPADPSKTILGVLNVDGPFPEETVDYLIPLEEVELKARQVVSMIHQFQVAPTAPVSPVVAERLSAMISSDVSARSKFSERCRTWLSTGVSPVVYRCMSLEKHLYISQNGEVKPCCQPGLPPFGNVINQSVWDIWNGAAYAEFKNAFHSEQPHKVCSGCVFRKKVPAADVARQVGIYDTW